MKTAAKRAGSGLPDRFPRIILFIKYFFINTAIFLPVFVLLNLNRQFGSFVELFSHFFQKFIMFQYISFICIGAVLYLNKIYQDKSFPVHFLIVFPFVCIISSAALISWIALNLLFFEHELSGRNIITALQGSIPSTISISAIMTFVFARISHLEYQLKITGSKSVESDDTENYFSLENIKGAESEISMDKISIRCNNEYILVPFADIIYLSAHNKTTVMHLPDKEYRIHRPLRSFQEKLPPGNFMRIHKSFIVNLNFISHLQYFMGGSYLVFLKDEDETNLPVGRSFAGSLKQRLNT